MPECVGLAVDYLISERVKAILHDKTGNIYTASRDIVVASPLTQIYLEYTVGIAFGIVFYIEIGKSAIADIVEKKLRILSKERLISVCDYRGMIAYCFRRMLLEKHISETHHANLAVFVGIAGQNRHIAVCARDKPLQYYFVGISRGIYLFYNPKSLIGVFGGIHLFHAVKRMLPVKHGTGRLDYHRIAEIGKIFPL